ncbi:MAG: calcium/sodium antiporter [Patescibacteria group bacterium]
MIILNLLIFLISLIALAASADILVRLSVSLAKRFRLSPLVIGATVVAIGTSFPELAVTISSIAQKSGDLSLGNIIGSNIANIGLVFGAALLFSPLKVGTAKTQRNNTFLLVVTVAFIFLQLAPYDVRRVLSPLLLLLAILFIFLETVWGKEGSLKEDLLYLLPHSPAPFNLFKWLALISSLAGLIISSNFLVSSALVIAAFFNISQEVVGLSIVAIGTSLPELSVSVAAAMKKEGKLLLGNVIGSNIINLTLLGSISVMFSNVSSSVHTLSLVALFLFTCAAFGVIKFYSGKVVGRWPGFVLLFSYLLYLFLVY